MRRPRLTSGDRRQCYRLSQCEKRAVVGARSDALARSTRRDGFSSSSGAFVVSMDGSPDGVSYAIPPVAGIGNFKGVMLCNRPEASSLFSTTAPPFRSAIAATHGEQLGLNPCRKLEGDVKIRGPSAALRKHVKWLRQLQRQIEMEQMHMDAAEEEESHRRERVKAHAERQREGVRRVKEERLGLSQAGAALPKGKQERAHKPLWAMTEAEKEDFEDEEAEGLINFAENLDFDEFMDDLEYREGLTAVKDNAGKIQREQDAFKDALLRDLDKSEEGSAAGSPRSSQLELKSVSGTSDRSERHGSETKSCPDGPKWDSSSVDSGRRTDTSMKDAGGSCAQFSSSHARCALEGISTADHREGARERRPHRRDATRRAEPACDCRVRRRTEPFEQKG